MADKSFDSPTPVGLALILCDSVYRDSRGKHALIGLFDTIRAETFPAVHPAAVAYVSLTAVRSQTICKLDVVHAQTDQIVFETSGSMPDYGGPLQVWELVFEIPSIEFSEPGTYYARLFGNDQIILKRPILVTSENGEDEESDGGSP